MTTLILATRNRHKAHEIQAILGKGFRCLSLRDFADAPDVVEDAATFAGNATKKAVQLAAWLAGAPAFAARVQSIQTASDDSVAADVSRRISPQRQSARPHVRGYEAEVFVLADDSGLEVDALDGAPGVHSARFAALDVAGAGNSSDADNNAKLLRLLQGVPWERRAARFRCVWALTPVLVQAAVPPPLVLVNELRQRTELYLGVCSGRIGFEPRGAHGFGYDPLFIPDGHERTLAALGEEVKGEISHRARALKKLKEGFVGGE